MQYKKIFNKDWRKETNRGAKTLFLLRRKKMPVASFCKQKLGKQNEVLRLTLQQKTCSTLLCGFEPRARDWEPIVEMFFF